MSGQVYLIHFDKPIGSDRHQAQHYIGYAANGLQRRIDEQSTSKGSRIMQFVTASGIEWRVVKTWPGTRELERRLKRQKHAWRHCPVCRETRKVARNG